MIAMASVAPRPVHRPPLLPDRYVPIRRIAAGGTATVWCAEDLALGRRVAIKLLAQPYASDHEAVRRFTREARAAAHLSSHPHVVTIYDVGETEAQAGPGRGAQPFIVMEHLSGGTVADALRVGAVTLDDAVRWLHEAAQALDFAHAKGVLHRDIKPANLLLDRSRRLHVADFGIAQLGWEDTLAATGHVLGTASYLAPERVLGRPATVASDLYGLAVTAFEVLTGELPFRADSYLVQARMHLEQEPPAPSERNPALPSRLDAALARGLAKDPERRWPSAEAFASAVSDALAPGPQPVAAYAPPAMLDRRADAVSRARRALADSGRPLRAPREHTREPSERRRARAPRPMSGPRRRRPALGLLAASATVVTLGVLGFAWAQSLGAPAAAPAKSVHLATASRPTAADRTARSHHSRRASHPAPKPKSKPAAPASTSTVQAVPASASTPAAGADALEARGHALLAAGQYAQAIEVLHRALAAAGPGSLTYAYALYDLGRALLLAGQPAEAARVLYQRLQIPNQTALVRATLLQALQQLAAQSKGSGPGIDLPPAAGRRHHGPGPGGPAGPGGAGGVPGGDGGAAN